jgi:hypothetical protein
MGKASSAKKVARVARSSSVSGSAGRDRIKLGFSAVIVVVMVLGVLLVGWSRASRDSGPAGPDGSEVWTAPYGVFICDGFVPTLGGEISTSPLDETGPDGRATLGTWGPTAGFGFTSNSITLPDGTVLSNGFDCNGTPGEVSVTTWAPDAAADTGLSRSAGFDTIRFSQTGERFTFAVVPAGTTIPQPADTPESTVSPDTDIPAAGTPDADIPATDAPAGEPPATTAP